MDNYCEKKSARVHTDQEVMGRKFIH